jgi:hypothetical protein
MPVKFPFSAVVGSDDLALALILTTISPEVGGVLVRGEKGTAKSTMVRALAGVLPPIEVISGDRFSTDPAEPGAQSPDGPFGADAATETRPVRLVELPIGAGEDRVLGSLHLERALSDGKAEYEPGLLAKIRGWFGEHRGHVVTGVVTAGAVAALMFAIGPRERVTERTTVRGGGIGVGTPAALESQPPEVEDLEVYEGSGTILTIEPEGDDDSGAAVIWISNEEEENTEDPI